jgi:tetratricopeptide (TPR) repeat protein
MRARLPGLLAGLLLALPVAAQQPPAPSPPAPAAPRVAPPRATPPQRNPAEARKAELDRAFEALKAAPDTASAALVEGRIRQLWGQAGSPAAALLLRRGMRNIEAKLPEEALEDFDAALVLEPGFAEAWYLRAQAYARAGDAAGAARDLQEALRLEPRHWPSLISLSALQEERGDAAAALRSMDAALVINPKVAGGAERVRELRRKAEGDAT